MNRQALRTVAQETVEILGRGEYRAPSGRIVRIGEEVARSVRGTVLHTPAELDDLLRGLPAERSRGPAAGSRIEVTDETTLTAARRLGTDDVVPLALSFASAKNPGGGFLTGAQAQEEGLARSSGLSASLHAAPAFYDVHRKQRDPLYTDHMIWSPRVPVFRADDGRLLEEPYPVAFLTSAAPNRGAIDDPRTAEQVPAALAVRARKVLAAAHAHGHRRVVLGAWGCGVFRNDPEEVASAFAAPLRPGAAFAGRFEHVVLAVWDPAPGAPRRTAFRKVFADLTTG
ncbi:TIGR02452 family protein [Antribacter sp. KLBMP9083]|uniref:TIGR02452 family protein n=1 Tax=Antribacter soli TaxID=2910976 RepID=A0AA41QHT4_9MICO|nr:TIGR02452 family protein [Antribacter soli]MCF4123326.1 TIGR02452 family protein [Antribacter soli]